MTPYTFIYKLQEAKKLLNEINLESVGIIEFNYRYIDTEEFTDVSKVKQVDQDLILEPLCL